LAQVIIEQAPIKQEKEKIYDFDKKKEIEIPKTWLCNYFLDQTIYGIQLISEGEKISWIFFLRAETKELADVRGEALLLQLEEKFPGVTGRVKTLPMITSFLDQTIRLEEIVLPSGIDRGKILLILDFQR
jgi:hypothetical protein